jgi:RNA polymerase sigma factor (TIGR02999 family)
MTAPAEQHIVSQLFTALREGSRETAGRMFEVLYPELRRLAASKMRRERADHTWQPTALVNELYLQLVQGRALADPVRAEKNAFFGLAGHMMMRLLIHHARPLRKRSQSVPMDEIPEGAMAASAGLADVELLLSNLSAVDPELRSVVEMKVFEGLGADSIAERMGCSVRTVERRWNFAKHWLAKELA